MNCPLCSTPNRDGASFCASCGAPLPSSTPLDIASCVACNAALRTGARFCHRCGRPAVSAPLPTPPIKSPTEDLICPACGQANPTSEQSCLRCGRPLVTLCPVCNSENRPGAKFCRSCQTPLFLMRCDLCGAENRAAARFCAVCGNQLVVRVPPRTPSATIGPQTTLPTPPRASQIICESCGGLTSAGARFCPHCGKTPTSRLLAIQQVYSTGMMPRGRTLRGSAGDEYMILRLIAQGGMGAVYEVGRLADSTRWAMKEMSESAIARGDRAATVAKFHEEAELLRGLVHDNLPGVVDVFEFNRRHYLVMELIEGQTLGQLLEAQGGPLPEKDVVKWGAQLCQVLAFLHSRTPPIIYRDLKPDNIMVDTGGRIKLIDFGIARRFKGGKRSDTLMLGTRGYAAPEQFGKRESDARTDLFALAATLHYLLTYENPTNRKLFEFPRLDTYPNLKISRRVGNALANALELSPEDRPADAASFYQLLTGKPMPPIPADAPRPSGQVLPAPDQAPIRSAPRAAALTGPLDLGTVERGAEPSATLSVTAASGPLVVASDSGWLVVTPELVAAGGGGVTVTVRTGSLALGRAEQSVVYRPRFVIDVLWWFALWLYSRHVRLFVPAPRLYQGKMSVGDQAALVSVTVAPPSGRTSAGRLASLVAVTIELAAGAIAIGLGVMAVL